MSATNFLDFSSLLRNAHLTEWIQNHKKVIGFYCSSIPEEIIHAAGMLPYRIRATNNLNYNLADSLLSQFNCSYVKSTLNLIMEDKYNFLNGIVIANTCDHVRRMYDIYKHKLNKNSQNPIALFFLSLPHLFDENGWLWVREELKLFQEQLSRNLNIEIDERKIQETNHLYKRNQELIRKIMEFRILPEPKLNGVDFLKISIANSSVRKEYANEKLEQLIMYYQQDEGPKIENVRARLMLLGSSIDNPAFIQILEHHGAIVVSDLLCTSERWGLKDPLWHYDNWNSEDPYYPIIQRIYGDCFCPRIMNGHSLRMNLIKQRIKEAKIDGIILQRLEFCDLHGCENMLIQQEMEEINGTPILSIDREYLLGDTGRLRTRVEAFLERLERS
ncbi:MAG: 2-hydroxyacyl-CoA dehydratase [Candidatus Lokiarchaeota archaeon]|nr:2-hydroxyacyl-CoA dehydratase [Candidatus Lokiarchaeota archaeon]